MISTEKLTLSFGGRTLFEDVNVRFIDDNCYGLIGANGAGKSTFLKILSGEIDPTSGSVSIQKGKRLGVLKQDQFAHDNDTVLDTVLMGYPELYKVYSERNAIYAKPEMSDEDGLRVGDLETLFGEMDGYTKEADAAAMLEELGIPTALHAKKMKELEAPQKVRVLLAQAIFGNPDVLLLDEPTNQLDFKTVDWLVKFLLNFKNTVIIISHDRHFLNKVCTHIADLDYKQINIYTGNYDFWQKSSQLLMTQKQDANKKAEAKVKELEEFIRRFSANASKSKQATSRKKLLEKIRPEELPTSSRRAPFIQFKAERPCGQKIVTLKNISYSENGEVLLKNVNIRLNKGDKVAVIGDNTKSKTALLSILAGETQPTNGEVEWGETIAHTYFPKDNTALFKNPMPITDWLRQFSDDSDTQFIQGFLGRMLFSGEEIHKNTQVLSGGEKARVKFSKMMLSGANCLILDEPTDHLDLESITAVNDALIKYEECVIFTSHDYELINTVANRIIEVSPNAIVDVNTTFEDYLENDRIRTMRQKL